MSNDNRKKRNKAQQHTTVTRVPISIAVADEHLTSDKFTELVKRLEAEGVRVQDQLMSLGVITGDVPASALKALAVIPGVAAVEQMRSFQLPPDGEPQ
jgi:predicted xylose isomerase-like sugar epimerase